MTIKYNPAFYKQYKIANVRIRNRFDPLRDEYEGYRSINVTNDWRAIFKVINEGGEEIIYFILLGTHKELYG
jgi:addiction module RelE/StbE family toxin